MHARRELEFWDKYNGPKNCSVCNEVRVEAEEEPLRPMDVSQPECRRCPLFNHIKRSNLPPEAVFPWRLYQDLNSPAVQQFGLTAEVLDAYDLDMTRGEFFDLLSLLNVVAREVDDYYHEKMKK